MGDKLAPVELSDRVHLTPQGERDGHFLPLPVTFGSCTGQSGFGKNRSGGRFGTISWGLACPPQGRPCARSWALRESDSKTAFASASGENTWRCDASRLPTARTARLIPGSDLRRTFSHNRMVRGDLPWGVPVTFRPSLLATMPAFADPVANAARHEAADRGR